MYFSFANLLLTRLYICQMLDVSYRLTIQNCIEDKYNIHRNKVTCCPSIRTLKEDKNDLSNSPHFFHVFVPLPLLPSNSPFPTFLQTEEPLTPISPPQKFHPISFPPPFLLSSFFLSFLTSLQTKVPLTQISPPSLIAENYSLGLFFPPLLSPFSHIGGEVENQRAVKILLM